jgi:hypothetical protein
MWCLFAIEPRHTIHRDKLSLVQQCLLTQCTRGYHPFASLQCPAEMGYALEAIDTTMCFITQEDLLQGIQEVEPE